MKNFLSARAKYIGIAVLVAAIGGSLTTDAPMAPFLPILAAGVFGILLGFCGALSYFADHKDYILGVCIAFTMFFIGGVIGGSNGFVGGLVGGGVIGALAVVWWMTSGKDDLND